MTDKRQVTEQSMNDLEAALKSLYDQAPTGIASIAGLIKENKEAEFYATGDEDGLESLLILAIDYLAQKEDMNPFDKISSMQTKLMYAKPHLYTKYVKSIEKRYKPQN